MTDFAHVFPAIISLVIMTYTSLHFAFRGLDTIATAPILNPVTSGSNFFIIFLMVTILGSSGSLIFGSATVGFLIATVILFVVAALLRFGQDAYAIACSVRGIMGTVMFSVAIVYGVMGGLMYLLWMFFTRLGYTGNLF